MGTQIDALESTKNAKKGTISLSITVDESEIEKALSSNAGKLLLSQLQSAISKNLYIAEINISQGDGGTDFETKENDLGEKYQILTITLPENLMGIVVGENKFATYDMATVFIHELSHAILRIQGVPSTKPNEEFVVHTTGQENQYTADTHYFTDVEI